MNFQKYSPITLDDETHTLYEWSEIKGIHWETIRSRLNIMKWPIREALSKNPKLKGQYLPKVRDPRQCRFSHINCIKCGYENLVLPSNRTYKIMKCFKCKTELPYRIEKGKIKRLCLNTP